MKHLKTYKLFEEIRVVGSSPIMHTLGDILSDLEDERFIVDLNGLWDREPGQDYVIKDNDPNGKDIFVRIWKDEFTYKEISKTLEHMFNYLESENYYVSKVSYGFENGASNTYDYSMVDAEKWTYDPKKCLGHLNGLDFTRNISFEFNLSTSDVHKKSRWVR